MSTYFLCQLYETLILAQNLRTHFVANRNFWVVSQKALYNLTKSKCFKHKIQDSVTKKIF